MMYFLRKLTALPPPPEPCGCKYGICNGQRNCRDVLRAEREAREAGLLPINETLHTPEVIASLQQRAFSAPVLPADGASQGLCDTTMTKRFANSACRCKTYEGNLGPCKTFLVGASGQCVYCDHEKSCHPSGTGAAEPDFETAALALGFRKRQQDEKWWHPNQQHFVKHHDTAGDIFDWYFGKGWGERAAEPWPPYIELPLTFWYKNHRDEESLRTAFPISIRFGTTEWHPEAQWLLKAFDRDKQAEREFAMRDMLATPPVRGDREAIARIIAPEAFAADYRHYFPDRSTLEQFEAYKKADAILSLPVQPDAGER